MLLLWTVEDLDELDDVEKPEGDVKELVVMGLKALESCYYDLRLRDYKSYYYYYVRLRAHKGYYHYYLMLRAYKSWWWW